MRIVLPIDTSRRMTRDWDKIRSIKKRAPKEFELKQHLDDGGYWTYSHACSWDAIQEWLQTNYDLKLSFYDGCFYPFLTEPITKSK